MSIRTMSKVWECSQHSGTNLLMLLAVADFSDDDGLAFPAVEKLAKKCRMSKRNAQDRLKELSDSGELTILKNQGPPPKYPNLFRVNLDSLEVKRTAPVQPTSPVQYSVERDAAHCIPGVKPTAPKPSVNRQEPPIHNRAAQKQQRSSSPSASKVVEDGFADFWKQYPRKVDKPKAKRAWSKLKASGQLLADMMTALERQKASEQWQKDGGQFIPYPATWLNGRRWEDEQQPPQQVASGIPANPIFAGAI